MNFPVSAVSGAEFRRRFVLFLLPGIYQSALPFLTLPLTTQILGPADFALYSVTNAISSFLATLAQLGSVFILAQRFTACAGEERRLLVSTIFFQNLMLSALCGLLMFALWPVVRGHWSIAAGVTMEMMAVVAVATIGSSLFTLVSMLAVFGHTPGYLSLMTMLKVTTSVAVTLIALFVFHLHVMSLFLGLLAAAIVDLIGSILLLLPLLVWRFDRKVARDCLRLGGWNSAAHLSMQGRLLLERSVVSTAAGLHDFGLFVHAQQYQNYVMLGARPVQQAMTPVMLEEAADPNAGFRRTGRATQMLFLTLTMFALAFALLGRELIHVLTNGKFDAAAPYAGLLIGVLLLQFSGRPQLARLLSQGRGRYLSVCNVVAVAASAALLVALAPRFGLVAALAATYAQFALFRLAFELDALRSGRLPFQDLSAVVGIAMVAAATAAVEVWNPGVWMRGALLLGGFGGVAAFNRLAIRDMTEQAGAVLSTLRHKIAAGGILPVRYRQQERGEP